MMQTSAIIDWVEEGFRRFNKSCEMAHRMTFDWVIYPDEEIANMLQELSEAIKWLNSLEQQGLSDRRVPSLIELLEGRIAGLTKTALKATRRHTATERFPFADVLRTLQLTTSHGSAGGS